MAKKAIKEVDIYVGARIRERRATLGLSQQTLASAIGLTFQQVQKYEKGTNRVGSSRLMQIANALDVSPNSFFEGAPTSARFAPSKLPPMQFVGDFVASKDGARLMEAFLKLPKEVQRSVVTLVEKIAANER